MSKSDTNIHLHNALKSQLVAHLGRLPQPAEIATAASKRYNPNTITEDYYFMDYLLLSVGLGGRITLHPKTGNSAPGSPGLPKSQVTPSSNMGQGDNVQAIAVTG